jgi:hypothetical protein
VSSYEYAARQKKVAKLVGALAAVGIPAHNARLMNEEQWASVAKCAGVKVPSDTTKHEVYQQLEDMVKSKTMTAREWIDKSKDAFSCF